MQPTGTIQLFFQKMVAASIEYGTKPMNSGRLFWRAI